MKMERKADSFLSTQATFPFLCYFIEGIFSTEFIIFNGFRISHEDEAFLEIKEIFTNIFSVTESFFKRINPRH